MLLPPSLLSFARLPLAAAFVGFAHRPPLALGVLLLAGITDVLDGYVARRLGQATATGAVVDGVCDKLFAAVVIGGLVLQGRLPALAAALLATRELGELPLVGWWVMHEDGRRARAEDPRANWLGKAATVCQFVTIAALLTQGRPSWLLLAACAATGVASAAVYWRRELRAAGTRAAAKAH
jgi:phosphatidylglycerophosphate synthase